MREACWAGLVALFAALCPVAAHALEHVTLRSGFAVDCTRREAVGDRVRLYLPSLPDAADGSGSYMEVGRASVVRVEVLPDPPAQAARRDVPSSLGTRETAEPTRAEIGEMLEHAGARHNIDADLLASVVRAESGGRVRAVSRTGARGLMQLMPGTAAEQGVGDAFAADQNIAGGTAYLDTLLARYHDNIALALAAYNAGPGAVARFHGVPPFRETRAYVARVIREFNRRKLAEMAAAATVARAR